MGADTRFMSAAAKSSAVNAESWEALTKQQLAQLPIGAQQLISLALHWEVEQAVMSGQSFETFAANLNARYHDTDRRRAVASYAQRVRTQP